MKKLLTLIYAAIFMCGSVAGYQNNTVKNPKCDESLNNCVSQCETSENCFDGKCTESRKCENSADCFDGCDTGCEEQACVSQRETAICVTVDGCKNAVNSDNRESKPFECESKDNCQNSQANICQGEKECNTSSNCKNDCSSENSCNSANSGKWSDLIEKVREALNQNSSCGSVTTNQMQTETSKPQTADTASTPALDEAGRVIELVNKERATNGLEPLEYRADIQNAADIRANEIVTSFSHTRPNGSSCFTVLNQIGVSYRAAGENIAYGQRSAEEVMNGWMNSPGHRANILSKNYTGIAVGVVQKGNVKYWVQIFIK